MLVSYEICDTREHDTVHLCLEICDFDARKLQLNPIHSGYVMPEFISKQRALICTNAIGVTDVNRDPSFNTGILDVLSTATLG